jgi:hypothetical protein
MPEKSYIGTFHVSIMHPLKNTFTEIDVVLMLVGGHIPQRRVTMRPDNLLPQTPLQWRVRVRAFAVEASSVLQLVWSSSLPAC